MNHVDPSILRGIADLPSRRPDSAFKPVESYRGGGVLWKKRQKRESDEVDRALNEVLNEMEAGAPGVASVNARPIVVTDRAGVAAVSGAVTDSVGASVPATAPARRLAGPAYTFPSSITALPEAELRDELDAVSMIFKSSKDYQAIRDRFCAVSIALNSVGKWAPRFRSQPLVQPFAKDTSSQLLHKDHLVIDLHWLWSTGVEAAMPAPYERLTAAGADFMFDLAAQCASENWASEFRAEDHLGLPDAVQWQMVTLRSVATARRYSDLFTGELNGKKRTPARV
jgi:hypothetical protein